MKTKAKKSVLLILLIVVAALLSVSTLSYWAEAVAGATNTGDSTNAIAIGKGGNAETVFAISGGADTSGKKLVPEGRKDVSADPTNAVEVKLITYKVKWNSKNTQAGAGNAGKLNVTLGTPVIAGTELGASLIKVEVVKNNLDIIVDGDEITVTLKATFSKEPENKADYTAIQGKAFTVPVTFDVTPVA